jgi:hypothetical protein
VLRGGVSWLMPIFMSMGYSMDHGLRLGHLAARGGHYEGVDLFVLVYALFMCPTECYLSGSHLEYTLCYCAFA